MLSRTVTLSLACQAVSSLMSGTCTSALLLLPLRSAMPKADLRGDRNSKPQLALMELQYFVITDRK